MILPDENGLIKCPNCKREYKPVLERKTDKPIQAEHPTATKEEREQLISGLCCDKCWNSFLGFPDESEGLI